MPAKGQHKPLAVRFWSKVDKRGSDECWPWLGYLAAAPRGYGHISDQGRVIGAHVAAMKLAGRFVEGLDVLHNCNNPSCVNERHLRMGAHRENMHDAILVGTFHYNPAKRGDLNSNRLLSAAMVPFLRALNAGGVSQSELGRFYGVSRKTIGKCVHRQTWSHV